jgi:hypothetical protein
MTEGSGSVSLTAGSGFGSGRPINIWIQRIRIRIRNTALQAFNHYCVQSKYLICALRVSKPILYLFFIFICPSFSFCSPIGSILISPLTFSYLCISYPKKNFFPPNFFKLLLRLLTTFFIFIISVAAFSHIFRG